MLLIRCPYCNCERAETDFTYAGEAHIARPDDPSSIDADDWRDFLYIRSNEKGINYERWRHFYGCGRFFNAVRDTVSDKFLATYEIAMPKPPLESFKDAPGKGAPKGKKTTSASSRNAAEKPGQKSKKKTNSPAGSSS